MDCIFCRIAKGEIPATIVHRDEHVVAFRDIRPQAPVHVLVVPTLHIASLWELADRDLAGRMLLAAAEVARAEKLDQGWRLIGNTREHAGQEVQHAHLHVLGGRPLGRMLPEARSGKSST